MSRAGPDLAPDGGCLARLLQAPDWLEALAGWLASHPDLSQRPNRAEICCVLLRDLVRLDEMLNEQLNVILHHPELQRLEASWRGLAYLVEQVLPGEGVKVRVLSISWRELARDLDRALEFDQSQLFKKVYTEELDAPGGEPFGILIGDYEVSHRPLRPGGLDTVRILGGVAEVAAAAFAPFVVGAHPTLFGLEDFGQLEQPINLQRTFEQADYLRWKALRGREEARFLGVALPRILLRRPYPTGPIAPGGLLFRERLGPGGQRNLLWGNAAYAFGAVVIRSFQGTGWLADIHGVRRGEEGGGLVVGLLPHACDEEAEGVAPQFSTDALLTPAQEQSLGALGLLALCRTPHSGLPVFYGNASLQAPERYDRPEATRNAELSALLRYILCASRFAHYLKVILRDKVGSFAEPSAIETLLADWLRNYCVGNDEATQEAKTRYPLHEARVRVQPVPGRPGVFRCVILLNPHFQLGRLEEGVRLVTELAGVAN